MFPRRRCWDRPLALRHSTTLTERNVKSFCSSFLLSIFFFFGCPLHSKENSESTLGTRVITKPQHTRALVIRNIFTIQGLVIRPRFCRSSSIPITRTYCPASVQRDTTHFFRKWYLATSCRGGGGRLQTRESTESARDAEGDKCWRENSISTICRVDRRNSKSKAQEIPSLTHPIDMMNNREKKQRVLSRLELLFFPSSPLPSSNISAHHKYLTGSTVSGRQTRLYWSKRPAVGFWWRGNKYRFIYFWFERDTVVAAVVANKQDAKKEMEEELGTRQRRMLLAWETVYCISYRWCNRIRCTKQKNRNAFACRQRKKASYPSVKLVRHQL